MKKLFFILTTIFLTSALWSQVRRDTTGWVIQSNVRPGILRTFDDNSGQVYIDTCVTCYGGGATPAYYAWNTVSATSFTATAANAYNIASGSLCTVTLPAVAAVNDRVLLSEAGTGGFTIQLAGSEVVHFEGGDTSAGGTVTYTGSHGVIELACTVPNTEWKVVNTTGKFCAN